MLDLLRIFSRKPVAMSLNAGRCPDCGEKGRLTGDPYHYGAFNVACEACQGRFKVVAQNGAFLEAWRI